MICRTQYGRMTHLPSRLALCGAVLLQLFSPVAIAQTVRGQVVDDSTRAPVPNAIVTLYDSAGAVVETVLSDSAGRFAFQVALGAYSFSVRRVGYAPTTTALFQVVSGAPTVNATITLPAAGIMLDPVTVEGERPRPFAPGPLADFYTRKERGLGGVFVTPEEMELRQPLYVTDVMRGMPGVRVVHSPELRNRWEIRMATALTLDGGLCAPVWYIDGVKLGKMGSVDDFLSGSHLAAVEVYRRASETPAEFLDSDSRCGVVVLWTKRAPRGR